MNSNNTFLKLWNFHIYGYCFQREYYYHQRQQGSHYVLGFISGVSDGKASAHKAGDLGLIRGSGRSPGEGNGSPLQYSCLENPTDGRAWWATVHGVAKSRT